MGEFIIFLLYILLGFGFGRVAKKTDTKLGDEVGPLFATLFIWPFFLIIAALNNDFFNDKKPRPDIE